jgi:hypothetical protein
MNLKPTPNSVFVNRMLIYRQITDFMVGIKPSSLIKKYHEIHDKYHS